MANVYSGTETKWGISEETTFGTAIADNGTFEQLEGPPPTGIDRGVFRINTVKYDGSRVRQDANVFYSQKGGMRSIVFSDLTVRRKDLGWLMYAVCQNVSEAAGDPFAKTYTINSSTTQPDFSGNAGYFCTVAIYDPIASYMQKFSSCILSELTLTADMQGDGLMKASGTFISGFASVGTANLSGTWAFNDQNYFEWRSPSKVQIAGANIILLGWELSIVNNAVRVGQDSSGDAEQYAIAIGDQGYDIGGSISALYDSPAEGYVNDSVTGVGRKIELATGTAANAGHFNITMNECFFEEGGLEYDRAEGQAVTMPFKANYDASGTSALAVFTVEDGLDQTW